MKTDVIQESRLEDGIALQQTEEWLPTGQAIIKHGFRVIIEEEVLGKLKFDKKCKYLRILSRL